MAASQTGCSNEDKYVSKQNLRYEKFLKKQIDSLDKEKRMRTKSLDAERRAFQERNRRLYSKPENIEHLSEHNSDKPVAEQNKELDKLWRSLFHKPYITGTGYSYIENLSRDMKPLVNRPLQWGINPLPSPNRGTNLPSVQQGSEPAFIGQVKGHTAYLNQRGEVKHLKKPVLPKERRLVLPPIGTQEHPEKIKRAKVHAAYAWKTKDVIHSSSKAHEKTRELEKRVQIESGKLAVDKADEKPTAEVRPVLVEAESEKEEKDIADETSMTFVTDIKLVEPDESVDETPQDTSEQQADSENKTERDADKIASISETKDEADKITSTLETKEEADAKRTRTAVLKSTLDSRRHSI